MDKEQYIVNIISYNESNKKIYEYKDVAENMVNVSRILITFKPKRGYEIVNVIIDRYIPLL